MFGWFRPRRRAVFLYATAFTFLAGAEAFAASNQANEKIDVTAFTHWDTTFAAAPSDTVMFGFAADNVVVCVPSVSAAVVTWYGKAPALRSNGGGIFGNTRLGRGFVSTAYTPPASTCYTYYGPPICRGVIITGTWTGTVLLMVDRRDK
mgnify:CR=1 FL=1